MSLGVVIKGTEGVVLACDSRVTVSAQREGAAPLSVNFDNATKLLSLGEGHNFVGAVTYGAAVIGSRTAHSLLPEFGALIENEPRLPVQEYARRLGEFYLAQWKKVTLEKVAGPSMTFVVGGYDVGDAYGKVFVVEVPGHPEPVPRNAGGEEFGMTWGGQLQIASRLIHGYDPMLPGLLKKELSLSDDQVGQLLGTLARSLEFSIPYQILPLQDCVDLATFLVRATMEAQDLAIGLRGVGGPIDVAVITRTEGLRFVQRKELLVGVSRGGGRL